MCSFPSLHYSLSWESNDLETLFQFPQEKYLHPNASSVIFGLLLKTVGNHLGSKLTTFHNFSEQKLNLSFSSLLIIHFPLSHHADLILILPRRRSKEDCKGDPGFLCYFGPSSKSLKGSKNWICPGNSDANVQVVTGVTWSALCT